MSFIVSHVRPSFKREGGLFVDLRWRRGYGSMRGAPNGKRRIARHARRRARIRQPSAPIGRKKQERAPVWQAGPAGRTSASSVSASQS